MLSEFCTGMEQEKSALVVYDATMDYENGRGGLAIYLPTQKGYVNYNFVHTVSEPKNADMWRLTIANLYNDKGEFVKQITKTGAEWEMAIRIQDRGDFVGGYAHGDEIYSSLILYVDGVETDITSIHQYKRFDEMKIVMDSVGYDPNDGTTKVLDHHKEYFIHKDGITLNQTVEWCNDYTLRANSYLSMMPPLKYSLTDASDIITDSYYTDVHSIPATIGSSASIRLEDVTSICVFGEESGIHFTMSKENYSPACVHSNVSSISDNRGLNYNKIYFVFAGADTVKAGDVWSGTTIYNIEWKYKGEK